MPDSDTLYDDIHDEMEDYVDMLDWFDNQRLANDLAGSELEGDDEQQLPGINCLFGIELHLTAAGFAPKSKKCPIPEHFLPENSFRFNPDQLEPFRKRIQQIAGMRIAAGFPADEINVAADAMIQRLNHAAKTGANLPESKDRPTPPLKSASSMIDLGLCAPQSLFHEKVPPWWNRLLLRCRDLCEEYKEDAKLREKLSGRMSDQELKHLDWREYIGERRYFYPVIDHSLVDWLHGESNQTPQEYPSLLYCVIERTMFNAQPLPERISGEMTQDHFFHLAQRVMAEAVLQQSPGGLMEFLPDKNQPGRGIFNVGPTVGYPNIEDTQLREFLLTGWTGIRVKNSRRHMPASPCPGGLWAEIQTLGLIRDSLSNGISTSNAEEAHVMHAWCAWCAGCWNEETIQSLFPDHLIGWYASRPIKPSGYDFNDDRFIKFCADLNALVTDRLTCFVSRKDWKSLTGIFKHYKGDVSLDIMLGIAETISPKDNLDRFEDFLNVNARPKQGDMKEYQRRIMSLPQATLRRIAICSGIAAPMILEAINDKQFSDLARILLGTFNEPLVVDEDENRTFQGGGNPWYPGRTQSGVTNLNPLYEAIASAAPQVWNDLIQEANSSRSLRGFSKSFLESMIAPAGNEQREINLFFDFPAIARLTHRVPSEPAAWLDEKLSRLDGLAELLDDKDSHWLNTIILTGVKNTRIAARLYAESRGIGSWRDAALEMAEQLHLPDSVPCGTYSISQVATMPRGVIIRKGPKPLKSVPAALSNDKHSMRVLHRCRLFHLLYRAIVRDVADEWIEAGTPPSKAYIRKFTDIFGVHPLMLLTKEPANPLTDGEIRSIRGKIIRVIGEDRMQRDTASSEGDACRVSGVVAEQLRHYDWTCDYILRWESHQITREFRRCGLSVSMHPVAESPDHPKFNPKGASNFELFCGKIGSQDIARVGEFEINRLVQLVAFEIGMARI